MGEALAGGAMSVRRLRRRLAEPVAIGGVVGFGKEHVLAAVATLHHVAGQTGCDNAGETRHA